MITNITQYMISALRVMIACYCDAGCMFSFIFLDLQKQKFKNLLSTVDFSFFPKMEIIQTYTRNLLVVIM
jgi:hypothetical protein